MLHRASWTGIALWIGLFGLSIALVVLIRTGWGQNQPLRKCIALSLLAHMLLALYAMTVQIVSTTPGSAREPERKRCCGTKAPSPGTSRPSAPCRMC
ncbi:MAG: hypothetical protein QM811_10345 [Pirellulales bacterium]